MKLYIIVQIFVTQNTSKLIIWKSASNLVMVVVKETNFMSNKNKLLWLMIVF